MSNYRFLKLTVLAALIAVNGCSSTANDKKYSMPASALEDNGPDLSEQKVSEPNQLPSLAGSTLTYLDTLKVHNGEKSSNEDEKNISNSEYLTVATEQLKLVDFIHQSFSVIGLNYVIDENEFRGKKTLQLLLKDIHIE